MKSNSFENNVVEHFNSLLHIFLPIAITGAFIISSLLFTMKQDLFLTANYFFVGLIALSLLISREKFSAHFKIYILIGLSAEISIVTLLLTPYITSGIMLVSISTLMVIGLQPRKQGAFYVAGSTIFLCFVYIYHFIWKIGPEPILETNSSISHMAIWSVYIINYLVYSTLLYFTLHSIKADLISSMDADKKNRDVINSLAYYDNMTGLPNLNNIEESINNQLPIKGYIVLINIRDLNLINSVYSKKIGDLIIQKSCHYLKKIAGTTDVIGRIGGNEFFWYMKDCNTVTMHENIRDFMLLTQGSNNHFKVDLPINYKIGVVASDGAYETVDHYLQKAYLALEEAKHTPSKQMAIYDKTIEAKMRKKEKIKELLHMAIEEKTFDVFYQAKVDCRTKETVGVEALARWNSSEFGYISPSQFIPIIDEMLLSAAFGEIIIENIANDFPAIQKKYGSQISISINISPLHLSNEAFIPYVEKSIIEKGIKPESILFEITEDSIIKDVAGISKVLSILHNMGFSISIDDFGTGYSSLSYLSHLEVDEIKIDQSFIKEMMNDSKNIKLLQAIISLKSIYNVTIIAEGVETKEQSDTLKAMNCYIHQGYYFSKPEPVNRNSSQFSIHYD